ncbi:hypothetical protein R1flu_026284 [Riccia fluitans]|uniref:FAS1 domain-containing protein n=1 Tax=Riccia fluitans TaxID=41844 RepID=A0ABD1XIG7_9MARC
MFVERKRPRDERHLSVRFGSVQPMSMKGDEMGRERERAGDVLGRLPEAKSARRQPPLQLLEKFACLKEPSQAGIAGRVLQYHMLTASYPIASIETRTAKGPWMAYTALAGQRLNISSKGSKITIIGNGITAKLTKQDVVSKTTQVVHGVDHLFIPANINRVCGKAASGASATALARRSRLLDVVMVMVSFTIVGHYYWPW